MSTATSVRSSRETGGLERLGAVPILLLFVISGASGLVLEVVWSRMLATLLGATTWGVLTVLVAYMGGLGVGSVWFGKRSGRAGPGLRVYGWLEIGIGLYTLAVPWLFLGIGRVYVLAARELGESESWGQAARIVAAVAALAVPTVLMGGTLPVLARVLESPERRAGRFPGLLYAANTLGAVAGCFLAGFALVPQLGVSTANALAAAADLAIGVLAIVLGRGEAGPGPADEPSAASPEGALGWRRVLLATAAYSGLCGLAYEVLWTRSLLAALTESTTYAFTMMLGVFLAGHALGSAIACRKGRDPTPDRAGDWGRLGRVQAMAGLSALVSLPLLIGAQDVLDRYVLVGPRSTFWGLIVPFHLGVCLLVVFVPSAFLGATFPIAARLYVGRSGQAGVRTGKLYAANTTGAIVGALAATAWLLPRLGTQQALEWLALGQAAWGILVELSTGGRRRLPSKLARASSLALLVAAAVVANDRLTLSSVYARKEPGTLLALSEGAGATVSVHQRREGDRVININSVNVAGTNRVLRTTQKLQAHLPLLLHEAPRAVLQVGFGSGGTCHSVSLHREVESIDVAELTPEVPRMASRFFQEVERNVLADPRVHIHIADARSYMAVACREYDLILSDSIHPRYRGNAALYSRDYFALCARRLRPGGLVSTWLPLFGMSTDDVRSVLASMRSVFPHMQVWYPSSETNENTIVIGSRTPIRLDWSRLEGRLSDPAISGDLAEVGISGLEPLLDVFLLGDRGVARFTAGARLNTDDHPILEFLAPRTLHRLPAWQANFDALRACREPVDPYLVGAGPEVRARLARWHSASTWKLEAQALELAARLPDAVAAYARCVRANPDDRQAALRLAALRRAFPDLLHGLPSPPPAS